MIGLKRHTVRVVEHSPDWLALAREACCRIQNSCGSLIVEVQHVGSTAVPGLTAKPILDLAAAIATIDVVPGLLEKLSALGYIYRNERKDSGGHLFVKESEPDVRIIHLHVVEKNGYQWKNYLRFRDLLRQEAVLRKEYATLKKDLERRFDGDRSAYTNAKHEFIQKVLKTEANKGTAPVSL